MSTSATVRRLQLGRELRRLRESAGVTREAAAAELECDLSKISKVETGKQTLQAAEVRALLTLYRVEGDAAEHVQVMAREARKRTTLSVAHWARTFVGLEADALEIKNFEPELVSGLLQTEDYIRAITQAANPTLAPAEVERMVSARRERQSRLLGEEGPLLRYVLNEAVLRRHVGGRAVMREQLAWLLDVAAHPRVSLQVLPFAAGAHAAMGATFMIMQLADPADLQLVYIENLWSAEYLDKAESVTAYTVVFDRLRAHALDTEHSVEFIATARKELS